MPKFQDPNPSNERTYNTKPPVPEEFLVRAYKRWRMKNESTHIPKDYLQAARWWIDHQEPGHPGETPYASSDSKGNQFWNTPYIDRLVASFRVFLKLSEPGKAFVVDAIENRNTPYRGDDIEFFKMVVEQQGVMDADPEAYKEKHADIMRKFA